MSDTPRTDAKAWGFRRALEKREGVGFVSLHRQAAGAVEAAIEWAKELERELAEAKRLICPGNGDYPNPVRCQSFEASEQNDPCPPGCCVMAKEEDVRMILAAIESEDG